ncbi:MAG: class II aldolase/adducin family protein [Spirochaetales bacterium]|jgi:ribulose-5-phosphate 4-epimerase/fuculose-1-phosphate aldolase|nr:class II aldolase/adducin family protein [Exilispira sp.]NMC67242.1 class II aldolase/adducin family protein [Spirochaetales bacterium]
MGLYVKEKEILLETSKLLVSKGYLLATGGNLSLKTSDEKSFLITPSNFDYFKMTIDDICVLDLNMNIIEGERKPSIESSMHCLVYKNRKDVKAIIHTHQVYASTLALIDMPVPALFDEQVRFLGKSIQIVPYAPSGTIFLQKNLSKFIRNYHNAYILKNHGVICFGDSIERAIDNIELVEKCSLTYLLALCTERKISKIPDIVKEVAFHKLREDQKKFDKNI